jgi:hypothetical protein
LNYSNIVSIDNAHCGFPLLAPDFRFASQPIRESNTTEGNVNSQTSYLAPIVGGCMLLAWHDSWNQAMNQRLVPIGPTFAFDQPSEQRAVLNMTESLYQSLSFSFVGARFSGLSLNR